MTQEEATQLLANCRDQIDLLDREILSLLNQRTTVVEQIGRVKQQANLPVYEPKREEEVFRNVTGNNSGPLPADAVKRVFERIIDEMRTVQRQKMLLEKAGKQETGDR
jgi:chorismate mutase-like protein